jgi:hypothetical protein
VRGTPVAAEVGAAIGIKKAAGGAADPAGALRDIRGKAEEIGVIAMQDTEGEGEAEVGAMKVIEGNTEIGAIVVEDLEGEVEVGALPKAECFWIMFHPPVFCTHSLALLSETILTCRIFVLRASSLCSVRILQKACQIGALVLILIGILDRYRRSCIRV